MRKRFVVTGAGRGIGLAITKELLSRGHVVGANCRAVSDGLDDLLERYRSSLHVIKFDVREPLSVKDGIDSFVARVGGLDGLVCCAGVAARPAFLINADLDVAREIIETNLIGSLTCAKFATRHLLKQPTSSIVAIGSVSSHSPLPGVTPYAASKGGLSSLMLAMAEEYKNRGLKCHCLSLPPVDTAMFASLPEEIRMEALSRYRLSVPLSPVEVARDVADLLKPEKSEN